MGRQNVFISYASKDKPWAEWFRERLIKHGFHVSTEASVLAAPSFIVELKRTIEKSDVMLAVMSPNYFQSTWCQQETAIAAATKVPIIPALVEPCEVEGLLQYYNWADLTSDRDRGLSAVIEAAKHLPALPTV